MRIQQRLAALEAANIGTAKHEVGQAFSDKLEEFIDGVFPKEPHACRMDHVARCCGLPNAGAMRLVFERDMTADAFREAAERVYGDDWPDQMQSTMDAAHERITEVYGSDGPLSFAAVFPPVLHAAEVVIEAVRRLAAVEAETSGKFARGSRSVRPPCLLRSILSASLPPSDRF